ncbi:MAG TPA: patatin-like phospholipase family protein [Gaiellaceae bacterium]|nr:patatin-like phospholipase family protein [Gaiellaceae bacterium]
MAATENYADLVFEGGGVKGIGLAGAIATLEERGYKHQNVAGTSAGSISAALLAAGYSAAELRDIIMTMDYRQFQDKGWEDKVPLIERSLSLLLDLGIYEGEFFLGWIRERLEHKGVRTFADLVHPDYADDPRFRHRLQVVVSDVTTHELLVLPRDAAKLGIEPDDLDVALAVRMSMSIPVFFEPVRFENPKTGQTHVIVDGGMLSNYPVWLFDCDDGTPPDWPTFGLLLVEPKPRVPIGARLPKPKMAGSGAGAVLDYVKALAQTMMEAHDRMYVEQASYARTIPIPTLGVGTTEFDLSKERALALFDSGRWAAEKFLKSWDFDAYIAEFRTGKEHSRREALVASMSESEVAAG